ncbi:MAG: aspartate-semialdehyde dehydrogenase [Deltaproteobacteria bacterium]|nr:aspartate-semialdehyde dehydrogenase [Deltaproteobacteria bacterium]
MGYTVAIVGATGAVGQQMLAVLEERDLPIDRLVPLASLRSAGQTITFRGEEITITELTEASFEGVDVALFSAGGSVSETFGPVAASAGAMVIDNTSAFRMANDVPLVVPEVNGEAALDAPRRIIANPNCSTIQMVVALAPLHREARVKRVVVSTYQAVAGAGARAIKELTEQAVAWANGSPEPPPEIFPHPMLFECLPQIGEFLPDGTSVEEEKMVEETKKIFADETIAVTATTVRVPVLVGHGEALNVEFEGPLSAERAKELLSTAPGVELVDEPEKNRYPLARQAAGKDPVYVGRVRNDATLPHGLNLWVVADNLRKGAALNAVQIAEFLHARDAL